MGLWSYSIADSVQGVIVIPPSVLIFFSGFETLSMQLLGTFVLVAVLMAMQFHFLDKNLLFKAFTS